MAGSSLFTLYSSVQLSTSILQAYLKGAFTSLVVAFYVFLAPFLGNRTAKNTALTLFSFTTFSVIFLYIRCTAIDPSDRTNSRRKKGAKLRGITKLNYKFILNPIIMRIVRKLEHKILKCCIRRKYLDPWNNNVQMDLILPFSPLVVDDELQGSGRREEQQACGAAGRGACHMCGRRGHVHGAGSCGGPEHGGLQALQEEGHEGELAFHLVTLRYIHHSVYIS
ncbi:putative S-acyltransferase [Platanthera guangdongensis]|uniref:S-acyltransferase n=1 Tax=Platanthera guangdongensis TaxID=2320717 RepID=A0ABR2M4T4_9ASPA